MSNYYIKIDNTPANIASVNTLNATGLISKNQTDYVIAFIQMFWNYANATKTIVYETEIKNPANPTEVFLHTKREFAETNPSDIFILLEVTPTNYTANKTVLDSLTGAVLYTTPQGFIDAYPNRLELTIAETTENF